MYDPFALQKIWSVFTVLICPSSCSFSFCTACLGPLLTALIWFLLPHSQHFLPYTAHIQSGWMDPQYLHGLTSLIWLSVRSASDACVLRASSCFAHIRTWSFLISLVFLMAVSFMYIFICMS